MAKVFNVTAVCMPELHYMVNLDSRLKAIKTLVDSGKYFTINRARQYGKTTTIMALARRLQEEYHVVLIDFQTFDSAKFQDGNVFAAAFAKSFLRSLKRGRTLMPESLQRAAAQLGESIRADGSFGLMELFEALSDFCDASDKPVVLMIDEVDSASNHQVFLDFLAQLRAYYISRASQATFRSVILAGVYDIKNLKRKFRTEEGHKVNSPWNIAADFKVEMSFSEDDIAGMLLEYENDHHTGMDIGEMAALLFGHTSGYPFLVSRLCKLLDEEVSAGKPSKGDAWNRNGFEEALRMLLEEKNTLFDSMIGKLTNYPELNGMLHSLLFAGKSISYNPYDPAMDAATMFGFIKNEHGEAVIANRIFETRLYNFYLSASEMQKLDIYKASLQDRNRFIEDGSLNMRLILEKFALHFNELYGNRTESFLEEEGRKLFLLYLRPIINGTGNYYIEARTRDFQRTDIIVDYNGEQYIIEMKVWHGSEYNKRGEQQLVGYLDAYGKEKGYMVSFNFNKKKEIGVHEIKIGEKTLIEASV